jgi:hypothetical protein
MKYNNMSLVWCLADKPVYVLVLFNFFINASDLVKGTIGLRSLLSNGDLNWKSFGSFRNLSSSIFIIDFWKLTGLPYVCEAICWSIVMAGVIKMKDSSSSLNSLASSSTMSMSSC